MTMISRRRFVVSTGIAAMALMAAPAFAAKAVLANRFSTIQVDASALENGKYGVHADWVRADLSLALAKAFPGRAGRNAPRLIVVIDSMSLGDYADPTDPGTDYLYGDAKIVAPDRTVLETIPIKLALTPQSAGRWDMPDIDRRRVRALCEAFAGWVTRYVAKSGK